MPPRKESPELIERPKSRDVPRNAKFVAASDLAGRTKVSSAKVALAFDKASRRTGAFTSKYAK